MVSRTLTIQMPKYSRAVSVNLNNYLRTDITGRYEGPFASI